ncbi:MAG: hypothetical protein Q4D80_06725 [Pseudomonadota bacterium]|nr:hypothetical protein [Pseudomonadota bacterium]
MKTIKLNNMLRILFIVLSTLFLLTACSSSTDGATPMTQSDPRYAAEKQRECWQRDFIEIFYKGIGKQTQNVYNTLTQENLFGVVALGFSIWMAYQILRHISAPGGESLGEFWTKVMRKGALCVFCGFLASSTDQLYYVLQNFIWPIYLTALEFTSEILKITAADDASKVKAIKIASEFADDKGADGVGAICEVYRNSFSDSSCEFKATSLPTDGSFPDGPMNMMGCMTCTISDRLSIGYDIAIRLFKIGEISAFLVACFLMVAFSIVKIGFVFYLVDSIFRLNIILIILPFLIMAYPFEQIRKWSVSGFKIILSSSAIMLCLGVTVSMTILAMQKILTQKDLDLGNSELYTEFSPSAFAMMFMGFLIIKATGLAVELSKNISGIETNAGFQRKLQQLVATIGRGVLLAVTGGTSKAATAIIDHVEKLRQIRDKYRKAKDKVNKTRNKLNAMAGRK